MRVSGVRSYADVGNEVISWNDRQTIHFPTTVHPLIIPSPRGLVVAMKIKHFSSMLLRLPGSAPVLQELIFMFFFPNGRRSL